MFEVLYEAASIAISWPTFGFILVGLFIGITVGALPGIGADLGMAIVLPLTLPLDGIDAILLLVTIYAGGMYGGSITAILLNVPGTPSAAATTFDGYPLSQAGKAKDALAISAVSSSIGGFITIIILFLFTPFIIEIVLRFYSYHYFLVAVLGLAMITIVSKGSMVKGLIAGLFGLQLSTVGVPAASPVPRFTFGSFALYNGIDYIAALIGLFAITEMLILATKEGGIADTNIEIQGSIVGGVRTALSKWVLIIKSALIGMSIGAIPGSGAAVSNFLAYGEALRSSSNSESFGKGNPEGVIAAEAANNGTVAGSLIPTLSFGIPGSGSTAILLGGLIMHGLRPGPDLFTDQLYITYTMLMSLLLVSIVILLVGLSIVTHLSYITKIDSHYIIPNIIVFAIVGGLALRTNWLDILTVVMLGFIGYVMRKYDYSDIAFVLGIVLGPIAETNFLRSLRISDGSFLIFISDPISILLVISIAIIFIGPHISVLLSYINSHNTK